MKSLVLMRHAKSSWKSSALSDFERPLNKRGRREAPFMARELLRHGIRPDLIISSAATRAMSTALIVAGELGIAPKAIHAEMRIYEAKTSDLLEVVRSLPGRARSALLVGHNPSISEFADTLTREDLDELPTAGVLRLDFPVDSWERIDRRTGNIRLFDYPKKHPRHA